MSLLHDEFSESPRLYRELADWFHLLTRPEDYAEEAAFYVETLRASAEHPIRTVLELGSGGGNNASHMKNEFHLTLIDLSAEMLDVSRGLNPECEHVQGDMRTVRLGRDFDAVFVHDAIGYMTSEADLRSAMQTAFVHCRPGGAALFAPDAVRETFRPFTDHGGHDGEGRALRYVEWTWDPEPADTVYVTDFAYLLREGSGDVRVAYDRHLLGIFARATWMDLLAETGFEARALVFHHSEEERPLDVFVGLRPTRT
ncbi:MAG TPA: class I SAM-dependent methyltransferase [Anaerolineales bacterium]|nr:class I SAM-dependent methyltransferase [Anaerolineales bacterium]